MGPNLTATVRNVSVTYHMGARSVTLPPDKWHTPRLNQSQTGWYSIYLSRRNGRLSWPRWPVPVCGGKLYTDIVYPPQTVIHPSTNPTVHGRESNSQPVVDHESDALSTILLHQSTYGVRCSVKYYRCHLPWVSSRAALHCRQTRTSPAAVQHASLSLSREFPGTSRTATAKCFAPSQRYHSDRQIAPIYSKHVNHQWSRSNDGIP